MSASKGDFGLTLLIRHLPREFSETDKLEFFQHFGAVSVKSVCLGGKMNEVVFATFSSPSVTKAALSRLHQMDVLGSHLVVEYARSSDSVSGEAGHLLLKKRTEMLPDEDKRQRLQDQLMRRLVSWSSKLNLSQPPPSHLRYHYPPPTPATLSNISKALSMHPRLYTQLLHLMNRMNLPPPFQDGYGSLPMQDQTTQTDCVWIQKSSSESEMESEEEQLPNHPDTLPSKRMLPRRAVRQVKRPRFIKPTPLPESTASVSLKPEEVFEKAETDVHPKKIELRFGVSLPTERSVVGEATTVSEASDSGFGTMHPPSKLPDCDDRNETRDHNEAGDDSVISAEQLASNRIPQKDLQILPVFKNYSPGVPSCRLYVKNVSKHAVARDLHFIYRRYLKSGSNNEEATNMYDVRLMTEGRMKGQAFITLPSVQLAQQALQETNGYILKDKPLVVQFARSAPAPAGSASSSES